MTIREVVRRLRAFEAGKPLPRYDTIHTRISPNAFAVAFVRMGGETRPWAIAYGPVGSVPKQVSVTDGRNRNEVETMMEGFAEDLLLHFRAEGFSFSPIEKDNLPVDDPPQIWVPGPSHLEMIHYLSYAYWRTRAEDDLLAASSVLSRFCGWLFRENANAGQQMVVDAAKLVREAYVFPTDDFSMTHLGSQQAWFGNKGSYGKKLLASRQAGKNSLGITMDTAIEQNLKVHVDDMRKKINVGQEASSSVEEIGKILDAETQLRWYAIEKAHKLLTNDLRPTNDGVSDLVHDSLSRFYYNFQQIERQQADPTRGPAFTPHPETDHHGSAAASAYYMRVMADSKFLPTLVHDDSELLNESLADGHSVRGKVVTVEVQTNGRWKEVFWTLRTLAADDFRMRSNESLSPLGSKNHQVKTLSVEFVSENEVEIYLQWTKSKTLAIVGENSRPPGDKAWEGQEVTFVPFDNSEFDRQASQAVWSSRDGLGSWLTHSKALRFPDEKVIDDVIQIDGDEQ